MLKSRPNFVRIGLLEPKTIPMFYLCYTFCTNMPMPSIAKGIPWQYFLHYCCWKLHFAPTKHIGQCTIFCAFKRWGHVRLPVLEEERVLAKSGMFQTAYTNGIVQWSMLSASTRVEHQEISPNVLQNNTGPLTEITSLFLLKCNRI